MGVGTLLLTNQDKPLYESWETGSRAADFLFFVSLVTSSSCSHHGRVWLVDLTAREQHSCLEPDLNYAAGGGSKQIIVMHVSHSEGQMCVCRRD